MGLNWIQPGRASVWPISIQQGRFRSGNIRLLRLQAREAETLLATELLLEGGRDLLIRSSRDCKHGEVIKA